MKVTTKLTNLVLVANEAPPEYVAGFIKIDDVEERNTALFIATLCSFIYGQDGIKLLPHEITAEHMTKYMDKFLSYSLLKHCGAL